MLAICLSAEFAVKGPKITYPAFRNKTFEMNGSDGDTEETKGQSAFKDGPGHSKEEEKG